MRPVIDATSSAVAADADIVYDVIVDLPDESHFSWRRRRGAAVQRQVVSVQSDLSLWLLQDVRLRKIVAGVTLVRDLSHQTTLQIFGMSATGLAPANLGFVEPPWEPLEVAVAKHRVAVDFDGVKLRKVDERVFLDSRDDVVAQVDLLQRRQSDEGLVANRLDLVPAEGQDLKVGKVAEGSRHVFDCVAEKKIGFSFR